MEAYFSHSYRDIPINTYFAELFTNAGITLWADQKNADWCVAKLERYIFEKDGFVSIIPRRIAADESITYSPYIARELMIARRARGPRILLVDDQILAQFQARFPPWAVPFFHDDPGTERTRHMAVIDQFRQTLRQEHQRPRRPYQPRLATVVAGNAPSLRDAASHVAAILRAKEYLPSVKSAASMDDAFDNVDVFESMLDSELCVFVLGNELAYSDLYLAMAHAHCIPSVRLRHDPGGSSAESEVSGVVRWTSSADLRPRFLSVFQNYLSAFEQTSSKEDLRARGTPRSGGDSWDPNDGPALLEHIRPEESYVSDRVLGVMGEIGRADASRTRSDQVCRGLYDRIKRDRFYYTFEPVISQPGVQRIRSPTEIGSSKCGTCLDFACLFASLLEAAHEQSVILVIRSSHGAHALTGYLTPDAVTWEASPQVGDIRAALRRGELVLFETTGAVEAREGTVAAETEMERREGGYMLDYQTAKNAGIRLMHDNIELQHFVDVRQLRQLRT